MLPIFNKKIIGDYNGEGFDSVESEDFEPGFGCVPLEKELRQPLPPDIPERKWSENDRLNWHYFTMSEQEKQLADDEYLAKHRII